ncbi:MAG: DUF2085 domain-containing protein [Thermoplasmatota archaeon]|nr:DUF2085 domain-containing protein [Candidatus Thermoplasmatota archaeon]
MRLPRITSSVLLAAFLLSLVWLILVVISPMLVPSNTLLDLSGRVGGHENENQFKDLGAIPHAIYWLGDAECHQLLNRSYTLNGNQMPFCARDLGLFVGIAIGFGFASFYRWKIPPLFVILGLVPIAVDGGVQAVTSYESNNLLRLATGMLAGLVLSLLLAHFVFVSQEDREKGSQKLPGDK